MFGVSTKVSVKEVEENSRILIEWGDGDEYTTVEFRFIPWKRPRRPDLESGTVDVTAHIVCRAYATTTRRSAR
jgi:DNA-directed RNA polymerase subunit E'/Rpb7